MNIPVSSLLKFQKLSSHIKPTGITPASDCIKFGGGAIIKNAYSAYVSFDCKESDEEILVPENDLWSIVRQTPSSFMNITKKGNKTIISDTRDVIPFGSIDLKEYGSIQLPEGDKMPLSEELLHAVGMAATVCAPMEVTPALYNFVHVGENTVCAGNGFMGVCYPIEEDYKVVLDGKVAAMISKSGVTSMSESQGHFFFYADNFTLAFSKHEMGWSNMRSFYKNIGERTFSLAATDVVSFGNLVLPLTKVFAMVTMETGKFEMTDSISDKAPRRDMEGLVLPEPFHYNAELMNKAIQSLDVEDLDFHNAQGCYFITSKDTKATAVIAKMNK